MEKKEKPFLKARNRYNNKEEEVVYKHCYKRARGYFLDAFFGKNAIKYLIFAAFCGLLFLFDFEKFDVVLLAYLPYVLLGIAVLAYVIGILIKLWFWKYSKNVIVTNQGIWIMIYSPFWKGKSWSGKKHFCSARWSFYDWGELHAVFPFESGISKICHLKDFAMERGDGEEEVFYLNPEDVAAIEEYAKQHINPKSRKKKREAKRKFTWRDFIKFK